MIDSSIWSDIRSFSISTPTIGIPTLNFPPADTATNDSFPNFDWSDVAGATQYELQVGKGHRWALVADYYNGFQSFNVSKPSQLEYCGNASGGNAADVAVKDSFALVASNDKIFIINISDPSTPQYRTWTSMGTGQLNGIIIRDTLAYLADWAYGLRIANVVNPLAPVLIGSYDSPGSPRGLALSGNYVYLADANNGLQVVDVSDPANPVLVGTLDTPGDAFAVAVAGNYAYVADNSGGMRVINISNPASPVESGSFTTVTNAMGVSIKGNLAYLAAGIDGLRIINISNPASPIEFGYHDSSGLSSDYRRVVLADSLAYVADWNNGLWVINVADPYSPRTLSRYNSQYYKSLALLDSFAPVKIDRIVSVSACQPDTFLADGAYYWRARAGAGTWGDYSPPRHYLMDTQAPPACWINSPSYNELINDKTPEFSIIKQYNEYRFQLQISIDTSFAVIIADTISMTETFELQTPLPDGWLYCRVRGGDLAGNWAVWSSRLPIKLDSQAPGQLTAVTANGANPSPWTKNNLFSINFTVPPDSSLIDGYFYKIGSAPSSNYDTTDYGVSFSKPFSISVGSDGVTPFYVWARDQAGNLDYRNNAMVNLRYDTIPPSGAIARSNEFSRTTNFTVSWNDGSDQGGSGLNGNYWIKYKINAGSWTDLDVNYAGTSYNFNGAQGNKYYFEAAAWDSAGNSEAFSGSAECSTMVDNTITCPILVLPYNGAVRDSAATAFLWQRATAQAGSRLQCSYNSSFTALVKDTLLAADSSGTLALGDSLYYWRVRGQNSGTDTSGWSPARTLRIDTQAPEAPFLAEPANDTLCNDNTPLFVWKETSGAVWYRLAVSPDSTFAAVVVDEVIDTTAYNIQVTLPDSAYFWKVRAGDAAGNWSAPSEKWRFTVDTKAPAVPVSVAPADNANLTTNLPQFIWRSSAQAVRYQLQVANNPSFSPLETDTALTDTSAVPVWGVNDGTHYWRVRCRDLAGNWSAYSNYRTLSIAGILQVALITPDTAQVWPPSQSVWIQFSKAIYTGIISTGTIDTSYIKIRGKHTPIVRHTFTWEATTNTLRVAPDTSFAANDTITVFINGKLRDYQNLSTSTLDGNNNGTATGDSTDSYQMTFYTSYFGDYDGNRLVNAADLGMFAWGWYQPTYYRMFEAGPLSGSWPHQRVYVGGSTRIDFEDLSGFIYSWNRADNPKSAKSGGYQDGPVSLEAVPGEKLKLTARVSPEIIFASMDAEIGKRIILVCLLLGKSNPI